MEPGTPPAPRVESRSSATERLHGPDLARFLAILGMVYLDIIFFAAFEARKVEGDAVFDSWMMAPLAIANGRASSLFVVLAGFGLTLMFGRAPGGTPKVGEEARRRRVAVYKRAAFLWVAGYAWQASGFWYASILQFYAFYLAVGAWCVGLSARALWRGAVGLVVLALVLNLVLDPEAGQVEGKWHSPASVFTNAEFWHPVSHLREYFFNGSYPIIPWFGYTLLGIWLGRQPFAERRWRARCMWISVGVLAAAVVLGLTVQGSVDEESVAHTAFSLDRSPPVPLFFISCAAQATFGIGLAYWFAERWAGTRLVAALAATGQMSFTIYIVRIFYGGGWEPGVVSFIPVLDQPSLAIGWLRVAIFVPLMILVSWWWKRRFGRGPLEGLMRRVSG